jgi:hypothetical protein
MALINLLDNLPVFGNERIVQYRTAVQGLVCGAVDDIATTMAGEDSVLHTASLSWFKFVFCNEEDPPEERVPPGFDFTGGQCAVDYFMAYSWEQEGLPGEFGTITRNIGETPPIAGPISRTEMNEFPNETQFVVVTGVPPNEGGRLLASGETVRNGRLLAVQRVDGLPDDCGDNPGRVPYSNNFTGTQFNRGDEIVPRQVVPVPSNGPGGVGVQNIEVGPIALGFDGTLTVDIEGEMFEITPELDLEPIARSVGEAIDAISDVASDLEQVGSDAADAKAASEEGRDCVCVPVEIELTATDCEGADTVETSQGQGIAGIASLIAISDGLNQLRSSLVCEVATTVEKVQPESQLFQEVWTLGNETGTPFTLPDDVIEVVISIDDGTANQRIFKGDGTSNEQGKFGQAFIGHVLDGEIYWGPPNLLWYRTHSLRVRRFEGLSRVIRVSGEPGASYAIVDTGLREV